MFPHSGGGKVEKGESKARRRVPQLHWMGERDPCAGAWDLRAAEGAWGPWKGLAFRELSGACLRDLRPRVSSQEEEPDTDGKSADTQGPGSPLQPCLPGSETSRAP